MRELPSSQETTNPLTEMTDFPALPNDTFIEPFDAARTLHDELVVTMPQLDSLARVKAAHYFSENAVTVEEASQMFINDDPFVQRRMLELYYGETEMSWQDALLGAITEVDSQGLDEAVMFADIIDNLFEEKKEADPSATLEAVFKHEAGMMIEEVLGVKSLPIRAVSSTLPTKYYPNIKTLYKEIQRPPLFIGDVQIRTRYDFNKLDLPEFRQPWEVPVSEVVRHLEQGAHIIIDSRRNSGKTHIFPKVLRAVAPENWEISEMTNNFLRGGEEVYAIGGDTARLMFESIAKGQDIDKVIEREQSMMVSDSPHVRRAITDVPDRKILIVDEIQQTLLDEKHLRTGTLERLVHWANTNNTQLILISALMDRRKVTFVNEKIGQAFQQQQQQRINIETLFERPQHRPEVLAKILGHLGVAPGAAEWIISEPTATPFRTMRGVTFLYHALTSIDYYEHIGDIRLRTTEKIGRLLTCTEIGNTKERLIDVLAVVCAGGGSEMVELAKHFDIPPPDYSKILQTDDIAPKDIL